ncbi:FKBP-type peptidyl-prolyl cis-trans isomerase [Marinospirillum sp.]|uniref:FKBP-type peptidyl-prolyl cis-trans isomerase n=1 Tax=Marinospirillum sp. TaxID=2183934 RepID=UPI003A86CF1A
MTHTKITPSSQVTLHFSLSLEDGQLVDSNFDQTPAQLIVGDGNLPEGFESLLLGLSEGDEQSFTVPPEKAFGQHNPSNIQLLARKDFTDADQLEVGMVFGFTDKAGGELPGVIAELDEQQVRVDFNHPLAGRTLTFKVRILTVQPAETLANPV